MTVTGVFVSSKEKRELAEGDVVFAQGETGSQMFGVVSGLIELRQDGQPVVLIGPDGTFGELSIIAVAMPVTIFVAPGPEVAIATPTLPLARA